MPHSSDALAADGGTSSLSIALITDRRDWHARELAKALAGLGARAVCVPLTACGIDTTKPSGLSIAGFGDRLPSAVLVNKHAVFVGRVPEKFFMRRPAEYCPHVVVGVLNRMTPSATLNWSSTTS